MANKIKKNNKTTKESISNQTAQDKGVGSTDFVRLLIRSKNEPFLSSIVAFDSIIVN